MLDFLVSAYAPLSIYNRSVIERGKKSLGEKNYGIKPEEGREGKEKLEKGSKRGNELVTNLIGSVSSSSGLLWYDGEGAL